MSFQDFWDSVKTTSEFEEKYVKHILGIEDLELMRKEASGIHKVHLIKQTPLLVLKAQNDPILGDDSIDEDVLA